MEAPNFICEWKSGLKLVFTFGIKDSIKETLKFYTLHFYNHTIAHPPNLTLQLVLLQVILGCGVDGSFKEVESFENMFLLLFEV